MDATKGIPEWCDIFFVSSRHVECLIVLRPVIYDDPNIAKQYLKSNEYWRIVNLNLSNDNNFIDWSHEREWRLDGSLEPYMINETRTYC